MKKAQAVAVRKMLFAALGFSLIVTGFAQTQVDLPVFMGKFTLTTQVQWNKTVLQPGDYTITIGSVGVPTFALVTNSKSGHAARFMSGINGGQTSAGNALLIREKDGKLRVYSLVLGSLGRVLVYDPALAREAVLEARAPQTVPVMLAKR